MEPVNSTNSPIDLDISDDNLTSVGSVSADNTSDYVTGMREWGVHLPSADHSLVFKLDVCQRMSPPPLPPWLLETPEKVRLMVANCSSWRKYSDYPQALANISESIAIRWIPFIIVVFIVAIIITSVVVLYTLYKSNRVKFQFFTDTMAQDLSPSRNYCLPSGGISTSVTIETQLSVCALEDDFSLGAMTPLHLAYTERRRRNTRDPCFFAAADRELLLHPAALGECGSSTGSTYVSDMFGSQCYSSQSLPILTDRSSLSQGSKLFPSNGSLIYDSDDTPSTASQNFRIRTGTGSGVVTSRRNGFLAGKQTVRGIMKRCQRAGEYLTQGIFKDTRASTATSDTPHRTFPTFNKLRRSFKHMRLPHQRPSKRSKTFDITSHENLDTSVAVEVSNGEPSMPGEKSKPNSNFSRDKIKSTVMNKLYPLSKSSNKRTKVTTLEISQESQNDISSKVKKSPFKKVKVPNVIRNWAKSRNKLEN